LDAHKKILCQVEVVDAEDMYGVEKTKAPRKKDGEVPKWKRDRDNLRAAMAACRDIAKETNAKTAKK
jgi:hypothetical protein